MKTFEEKLNDLSSKGYKYGGSVACPAVGGDHESEIWQSNDGKHQADVCRVCHTVEQK